MPPLPPKFSVTEVNNILEKVACHGTFCPCKHDSIVSSPSPRYCFDSRNARTTSTNPPTNPLKGAHSFSFRERNLPNFKISTRRRAQIPKKTPAKHIWMKKNSLN